MTSRSHREDGDADGEAEEDGGGGDDGEGSCGVGAEGALLPLLLPLLLLPLLPPSIKWCADPCRAVWEAMPRCTSAKERRA